MPDQNLIARSSIFDANGRKIKVMNYARAGSLNGGGDLSFAQEFKRTFKHPLGFSLKRIAVVDATTPRDRKIELADERVIAQEVRGLIRTAGTRNIPQLLLGINNHLHRPQWKTTSPTASCVVGEIYLDRSAQSLNGVFGGAGDSQIFIYRANGWELIHGGSMLQKEFKTKFEMLLASVKPHWNKVHRDFEDGLITQEERDQLLEAITDELLTPKEEELLADISAWRSPPLGRYSDDQREAVGFNPSTEHDQNDAIQKEFTGVFLCTDGVDIGVETLNAISARNRKHGLPAACIDNRYLEPVHEVADMAVCNLSLID